MAPPRRQDALDYHSQGRPGKIQIGITKPYKTQRDLALAYSPGVAEPCLEIAANPDEVFRYTARGNLVAVVTNGTAVLGLGNIGALAGKPVMEGKSVLFKAFADIDAFDIEINAPTVDDVVRFCEMLEPTVGGINLEDIAAPACFEIEARLRATLQVPVFHDDQHGTAIIGGAGLLNAAEVAGKSLGNLRVVFCGAGAAGVATAEHFVRLGVNREAITLVDINGVVHPGREDLDPYRAAFAHPGKARSLADAMHGADVVVGLSVAGTINGGMVRSMAPRPLIFALANPLPEIMPEEVRAVRSDAIIATGRSDYPNQVNNVLGFPFIFRGALDVGARGINEAMEMAATRAIASLAREEVPESVLVAYGLDTLRFGPEYIIPKPLDSRVLLRVAPAVAQAAMESGVARRPIDLAVYADRLEARFGPGRALMRNLTARAMRDPQRLVFAEGHDPRILRAARVLVDEKIALPIVLGDPLRIAQAATEAEVELDGIQVADPATDPNRDAYARALWERRRRKGVTMGSADQLVVERLYFGSLMVEAGHADALILGIEAYYPDKLYGPLQVLGTEPGAVAAGVVVLVHDTGVYFLADTTITEHPDARTIAKIASQTAKLVRRLGMEPRVALLSFSNFGSARTPDTAKMSEAARLLHESEPELEADGEMMAATALNPEMLREVFPFAKLTGRANVLVFPHLAGASIGYQLVKSLGNAETVGPIMLGIGKPCHVLRRDAGVQDVVNMAVIAAVDSISRA